MAISKENTRIQATMSKNQLEEKAKLENRSVSNYIVTLIQKGIANSSHLKRIGNFLVNIITTSKAIRKDEFTLVDSIDLYGNKIKIFTVK